MSKIIRHVANGPTVYIGDKQLDFESEAIAEKKLGTLFPLVSVLTDADGAKLIPIQEVNKIEQEYRQGQQAAHEKGFKEGYQQGYEKGLEEARKIIGQFEQAVKDAVNQRTIVLQEAKQKILELVMKISRKVTFDAVEADPETTAVMISSIIKQLIDRGQLKIKVNPNHLPVVEQNIDRFLGDSTDIKDIKIEADPRVRYGGCFIETPTGDIDARLSSQFEVIEETIRSGEDT